jgi:hypothetical protein
MSQATEPMSVRRRIGGCLQAKQWLRLPFPQEQPMRHVADLNKVLFQPGSFRPKLPKPTFSYCQSFRFLPPADSRGMHLPNSAEYGGKKAHLNAERRTQNAERRIHECMNAEREEKRHATLFNKRVHLNDY